MARQVTKLTVFLSSPSDLVQERKGLFDMVQEFNLTWGDRLGLELELIRWETHSVSGIGSDAQQVLNADLPADYDIFVGMMGARFGTATPRAGSGTEEEFERAVTRHQNDPDSIRVMFYFKDPQIVLSEVDPNELRSVLRFRQKIESLGALHHTFRTPEELVGLLRIHLSKQVQTWGTKWGKSPGDRPAKSASSAGADLHVGEGGSEYDPLTVEFLELMQTAAELMNDSSDSWNWITGVMEDSTARTAVIVADAKNDGSQIQTSLPFRKRRLVERSTKVLLQFAARIELEIPFVSASFDECMSSLSRAIGIYAQHPGRNSNSDDPHIKKLISTLETFIENANTNLFQLSRLREAIATGPSPAPDLAFARTRAEASVLNLIELVTRQVEYTRKIISEITDV